MPRSFLKWPGGKYRLLKPILMLLPKGPLLAEPFVGSASVFLNTEYREYLLNDSNPDLIALFKRIQKQGKRFIHRAQKLFVSKNNTEKQYYTFRDQFNESVDPNERSELFLYLNRHGFNGLVRYNQKGYYNVPFGRYLSPYFPEEEMLFFHQKAKTAEFFCSDFSNFLETLPKKSVVYCDPPYVPLSETSDFNAYTRQGFSLAQQDQLAEWARNFSQKGARVLISNHATAFTKKAYQGAVIHQVQVQRNISAHAAFRRPVQELLALF